MERWRVRKLRGFFINPDGSIVESGETMEVAAPKGRRLVAAGSAEVVSRRVIKASD